MENLKQAATEFLSHRRIAVAGVSRTHPDAANFIFRKLRERGYVAFAVNAHADEIEGGICYRSLAAIPGGVDAVVVATHPDAAAGVVRECIALHIPRVWIHKSFGAGSLSPEAVELCRENDIAVIGGGCPMMFLEPADFAHRCFRFVFGALGKLPDGKAYRVAEPVG